MEWEKLLNSNRLKGGRRPEAPSRPNYIQDYDRVVFSEPFRRLANKTQVHPLYEHDHLHHRLIHSIETSSVGRSLANQVEHQLLSSEVEFDRRFSGRINGAVQAACVAHDIGNPPFGHSGEDAIGNWFGDAFADKNLFEGWSELDERKKLEFERFEGNAQGFRILTRTDMYREDGGMRLSFATLGAFVKYPFRASETEKPKYGIFEGDWELFEEVAQSVGLKKSYASVNGKMVERYVRHPLVYLVEAADDISYNIVDLEDAHTSGDLSFDKVKDLLEALIGKEMPRREHQSDAEFIAYLRAMAIGEAVEACSNAFMQSYQNLMSGSFEHSDLVAASSVAGQISKIKKISREELFTSPRKTSLEITGRNTLRKILSAVAPVYQCLREKKWNADSLDGYERQVWKACGLDLRAVSNEYEALHSLADFVSGMTDRYAMKIANQF
ncbi:MAG: dNTP triphosphohydrolase [Pseudomonadota bacterium]|nr:dNTP triphosphohydrolase [Pseudomonadota bacterium]